MSRFVIHLDKDKKITVATDENLVKKYNDANLTPRSGTLADPFSTTLTWENGSVSLSKIIAVIKD